MICTILLTCPGLRWLGRYRAAALAMPACGQQQGSLGPSHGASGSCIASSDSWLRYLQHCRRLLAAPGCMAAAAVLASIMSTCRCAAPLLLRRCPHPVLAAAHPYPNPAPSCTPALTRSAWATGALISTAAASAAAAKPAAARLSAAATTAVRAARRCWGWARAWSLALQIRGRGGGQKGRQRWQGGTAPPLAASHPQKTDWAACMVMGAVGPSTEGLQARLGCTGGRIWAEIRSCSRPARSLLPHLN